MGSEKPQYLKQGHVQFSCTTLLLFPKRHHAQRERENLLKGKKDILSILKKLRSFTWKNLRTPETQSSALTLGHHVLQLIASYSL